LSKKKTHNNGFDSDEKGGILAHWFYPGINLGDLHFALSKYWVNEVTSPGHSLYVVTIHK